MVIACRLDSSDKDKVDEDTTNFPKDSLEKSPPDQPFHYIKDEIDLKSTSPLPGKTLARKNRDRQIRDLQLQRKSVRESSCTDRGLW